MSELRDILSDTVSRLLEDELDKTALAASESGEWQQSVWGALEATGLTRALTPDSDGGAGALFEDVFAVLYGCGRAAAPVPIAESLAGSWLLSAFGLPLPEGLITIAPVDIAAPLSLSTDGTTVHGAVDHVPWGRQATHIVAEAVSGDESHLVLIEQASAEVMPNANLAGDFRDRLTFDNAPVLGAKSLGALGSYHPVQLLGAVMRAAQMAGASGWVLDTTLGYANDRIQFGRPLGKLQAIQHYLATLASRVAQATSASELAFKALDRGVDHLGDAGLDIAAAKVVVGDAAWAATSVGHQVHGAIGFTQEYELHYRTRRLWCWRAEFGSEAYWAEQIGRQTVAAGADALWPNMTA